MRLVRLILLVLALSAFYVVPTSAQSNVTYKFYAYKDGNGNGYADYDGSDVCLTGTLTVYRVATQGGLQQFFYVPLPNAQYTITTWQQMIDCKTMSSTTYSIAANTAYRIQAFSATTNFTTGTGSNIYYMGHRVP